MYTLFKLYSSTCLSIDFPNVPECEAMLIRHTLLAKHYVPEYQILHEERSVPRLLYQCQSVNTPIVPIIATASASICLQTFKSVIIQAPIHVWAVSHLGRSISNKGKKKNCAQGLRRINKVRASEVRESGCANLGTYMAGWSRLCVRKHVRIAYQGYTTYG